jgi:hypothetical protein
MARDGMAAHVSSLFLTAVITVDWFDDIQGLMWEMNCTQYIMSRYLIVKVLVVSTWAGINRK